MTSIANSVVTIQTSPQEVPSPNQAGGELTVIAHFLQQQGLLAAIAEYVRFARRRFGRYEVIDFVAVLFGYAISGERTLFFLASPQFLSSAALFASRCAVSAGSPGHDLLLCLP